MTHQRITITVSAVTYATAFVQPRFPNANEQAFGVGRPDSFDDTMVSLHPANTHVTPRSQLGRLLLLQLGSAGELSGHV